MFAIEQRPMPAGEDLDTLLPMLVGPFRRSRMDHPQEVRNELIEAQYRFCGGTVSGDEDHIFVTAGIYDHPNDLQEAIDIVQAEISHFEVLPGDQASLNTKPSFFRTITPREVFMAWTRGNYYFTASARSKKAEKNLGRFMEAFPY